MPTVRFWKGVPAKLETNLKLHRQLQPGYKGLDQGFLGEANGVTQGSAQSHSPKAHPQAQVKAALLTR